MRLLCIFSFLSLLNCKTQNQQASNNQDSLVVKKYMNTITDSELEKMLYTYASDEMNGREAGTEGEAKATVYIKDFYKNLNIEAAPGTNDYYQTIPAGTFSGLSTDANNVVAYIEGTDLKEEVLVISAHLDHIGIHDGQVFNGADDDGSGTVAVMEIAEAFQQAVKDGYRPRRTIVFLHVTAEEKGLFGSKYYTDNPLFELDKTITDLNIDMIGRVDPAHEGNENYIYLIGSDMLSAQLHTVSEQSNKEFTNLDLDYTFNAENDPNRFYYRSDHYNFAKNNIPVIFYFNGTHADYHQASDTPDKINYPLLQKRTQLIFATAWKIANQDNRPALD